MPKRRQAIPFTIIDAYGATGTQRANHRYTGTVIHNIHINMYHMPLLAWPHYDCNITIEVEKTYEMGCSFFYI